MKPIKKIVKNEAVVLVVGEKVRGLSFSSKNLNLEQLRTAENKLFFILFYLKNYPTFDVLGFIFDLNPSNFMNKMWNNYYRF